jgi:hypothetical protein
VQVARVAVAGHRSRKAGDSPMHRSRKQPRRRRDRTLRRCGSNR